MTTPFSEEFCTLPLRSDVRSISELDFFERLGDRSKSGVGVGRKSEPGSLGYNSSESKRSACWKRCMQQWIVERGMQSKSVASAYFQYSDIYIYISL